jgi:hypothetical protein
MFKNVSFQYRFASMKVETEAQSPNNNKEAEPSSLDKL